MSFANIQFVSFFFFRNCFFCQVLIDVCLSASHSVILFVVVASAGMVLAFPAIILSPIFSKNWEKNKNKLNTNTTSHPSIHPSSHPASHSFIHSIIHPSVYVSNHFSFWAFYKLPFPLAHDFFFFFMNFAFAFIFRKIHMAWHGMKWKYVISPYRYPL